MFRNKLTTVALTAVAAVMLIAVVGCESGAPTSSNNDAMDAALAPAFGGGFGNEDNSVRVSGEILKVDAEQEVILLDTENSTTPGDLIIYADKYTVLVLVDGRQADMDFNLISDGMIVSVRGERQSDGVIDADRIELRQASRDDADVTGNTVFGGPGFGNEDNSVRVSGEILKVDAEREVILLDTENSTTPGDLIIHADKYTVLVLIDGRQAQMDFNLISDGMIVSVWGERQSDGIVDAERIELRQAARDDADITGNTVFGFGGFGNEDNKSSIFGTVIKVDYDHRILVLDTENSTTPLNAVVLVDKPAKLVQTDGRSVDLDFRVLSEGLKLTAIGENRDDGTMLSTLLVLEQAGRTERDADAVH